MTDEQAKTVGYKFGVSNPDELYDLKERWQERGYIFSYPERPFHGRHPDGDHVILKYHGLTHVTAESARKLGME